MIALVLSLRQSQRIDLEQLDLTGGVSSSIFQLVEAWLQESTDHWNALRAISRRKSDPGFHSVVDFILVGVCPELRRSCFAFYDQRGKPLRDFVTERQRNYFERKMLLFLEVSYAMFCDKRSASWAQTLEIVHNLEEAAA